MPPPYKHLLVEKRGKILVVKFNHPQKKNALDSDMYVDLTEIFEKAAKDDSITVMVLTGVGDFYSSGNDITGAMKREGSNDFEETLKESRGMITQFIHQFIRFPKLLIGLVNGPAIGIAVTTAALCDVVYCSEKAYFLTPFTRMGLRPEGGSTYTFPRIMGNSKAYEMLLLNHKMSADEAYKFNFVSDVYKADEVESKIWPKIVEYSEIMPGTFVASKALVKKFDIAKLEEAVEAECDAIDESWKSNDFYTAVMQFMSRKSKM